MIRHPAIIREAAGRVAKAVDRSVNELRDGIVEQEPTLTDGMLARTAHAISGLSVHGVAWTAKARTDPGTHAQEKKFAADFCGVLSIELPGFAINKGFLAKWIEPRVSFPDGE